MIMLAFDVLCTHRHLLKNVYYMKSLFFLKKVTTLWWLFVAVFVVMIAYFSCNRFDAIVYVEHQIVSNGPYCGVRLFVKDNNVCKCVYEEDGDKTTKEVSYEVDKERNEIVCYFTHPVYECLHVIRFDFQQRKAWLSSPETDSFSLVKVEVLDWSKLEELFGINE